MTPYHLLPKMAIYLGAVVSIAQVACSHLQKQKRDEPLGRIELLEKLTTGSVPKPAQGHEQTNLTLELRRELAFLYWTHSKDDSKALNIFDQLVEKYNDPWANLAKLVMALARENHEQSWLTATSILNHAMQSSCDHSSTEQAAFRFAARQLDTIVNRRISGHSDFLDWFDAINSKSFDPLVSNMLLGLRAQIARSQGADYSKFYQQQGCIKSWSVARTESDFWLAGANEQVAASKLVELSCAIRIWHSSPNTGTAVLKTELETVSDSIVLELYSGDPARYYFDGQLIFRSDHFDRFQPRSRAMTIQSIAGRHTLTIEIPAYDDKSWIMVRASPDSSNPLFYDKGSSSETPNTVIRDPEQKMPRSQPIVETKSLTFLYENFKLPGPETSFQGIALYLAAAEALATGDHDRAEEYAESLSKYEKFFEAKLLLAKIAHLDPSRSAQHRRSRQQHFLEAVVDEAPELLNAWSELIEFDVLLRGSPNNVNRGLEAFKNSQHANIDGEWLKWRKAIQMGDLDRATAALDRWEQSYPRDCRLLLAKRTLAADQGNEQLLDILAARLANCEGTLGLRARLARRRGQFRLAEMLWREKLIRVPDDLAAMKDLASTLSQQGRNQEALDLYNKILEFSPRETSIQLAKADLLRLRDDGPEQAKQWLAIAQKINPTDWRLWQVGRQVGLLDPLLKIRKNPIDLFQLYWQKDGKSETSSVIVYKNTKVQISDDGSSRRRIHEIRHIRNRDDLDVSGEFELPSGSRMIDFHTIKLNLRDSPLRDVNQEKGQFPVPEQIDAERLPSGNHYVLRDLEVGDLINLEYLQVEARDPELPGYVDLGVEQLQDEHLPVYQAELEVSFPAQLGLKVQPQHDCPEPMVEEVNGIRTIRYVATNLEPLPRENFARDIEDDAMGVRLSTEISMESWLGALSRQLRGSLQSNHEMRQIAQNIVSKGGNGPKDKVYSIWSWVMENIADEGNPSKSASRSLADRRGSRLTVLASMFHSVGLNWQFWLVKNRFATNSDLPKSPRLDAYDALVVAVRIPQEKRWSIIFPVSKAWPIDYVPAAYSNMPAYIVPFNRPLYSASELRNTGKSQPLLLPKNPRESDSRIYDIEIVVDAEGDGRGTGSLRIRGAEAVQWRMMLERNSLESLPDLFEKYELVNWYLESVELQKVSLNPDIPWSDGVQLDFELALPDFATHKFSTIGEQNGQSVSIPMNVIAMHKYGAPYIQSTQRSRSILLKNAGLIVANIRYRFADHYLTQWPSEQVFGDSSLVSFKRRLKKISANRSDFQLHSESYLRSMVLEPTAYPRLQKWVNKVKAEGELRIHLKAKTNTRGDFTTSRN